MKTGTTNDRFTINSQDIVDLIEEKQEIILKRYKEEMVEEIREIVGCKEDCLEVSYYTYAWLGFKKILGKPVPIIFIGVAFMAIIALIKHYI
jgi:hypothetical protein